MDAFDLGMPDQEHRRAVRYDIVTAVQFRCRGDEWRDGTTVNVGRLGLLMRTRCVTPVSGVLDIRVTLTTSHTRTGAAFAGSGRVVRDEPASVSGERLVALAFNGFRLESSEVGT